MNKNRLRRKTQQGWHPALDHSSPRTAPSLLNCHGTWPSSLESETYESSTFPILQGYDIETPLITSQSHHSSPQDQGVGYGGNPILPQLGDWQGPQDRNHSMPAQGIGAVRVDKIPTPIVGGIQPIPYKPKDNTCVEDGDDYLKWTIPREVTQGTQNLSEEEEETVTRYLACPFYKHDPKHFSIPKWKSCAHPGYENMRRLKSVSVCFVSIPSERRC